jgi:hypothetical protein
VRCRTWLDLPIGTASAFYEPHRIRNIDLHQVRRLRSNKFELAGQRPIAWRRLGRPVRSLQKKEGQSHQQLDLMSALGQSSCAHENKTASPRDEACRWALIIRWPAKSDLDQLYQSIVVGWETISAGAEVTRSTSTLPLCGVAVPHAPTAISHAPLCRAQSRATIVQLSGGAPVPSLVIAQTALSPREAAVTLARSGQLAKAIEALQHLMAARPRGP